MLAGILKPLTSDKKPEGEEGEESQILLEEEEAALLLAQDQEGDQPQAAAEAETEGAPVGDLSEKKHVKRPAKKRKPTNKKEGEDRKQPGGAR